jgi:hypothetical protein
MGGDVIIAIQLGHSGRGPAFAGRKPRCLRRTDNDNGTMFLDLQQWGKGCR